MILTVRCKPEAGKERPGGCHLNKSHFVSGLVGKLLGIVPLSEVRDVLTVDSQGRPFLQLCVAPLSFK